MRRAGCSIGALLVLVLAAPASGATIEVETDVDEFGAGGTSACTLREAVEAARTDDAFGGCRSGSGGDKILMPGSVTLGIDSGGSGTNASGDLDYNSKQKLTIIGSEEPAPTLIAIMPEPGWEERALEVTKGKVTLRGLDISGFEATENAGGAVRAAGRKTVLKLSGTLMEENSAILHGGAVACEGCKSLNLSGPFGFVENITTGAEFPEGGAIWTDGPLVAKGVEGFAGFPWTRSRFSDNQTATLSPFVGDAGAIYATDDVTISKTLFLNNRAVGNASGGALSIVVPAPEKATIKLTDSTFEDNSAVGRGGAVNLLGTGTKLKVTRVAMLDNESQTFGGGIFSQADATIKESFFDGNTVNAEESSSSALGGGIYANSGNQAEPNTLRIVSSSVTNNQASGGNNQHGAGIWTSGMDLRLLNSSVGANEAPDSGATGGGVYVDQNESVSAGPPTGSALIEFTSFRDNVAGPGTTEGDAIYASLADNEISIRASIIDEGADGCTVTPGTDIQSGGYNVEDIVDADCGIDAATDSHDNDLLGPVSENGSPPVGAPQSGPTTLIIPLHNAFNSPTSAAADIVPPEQCEGGKTLKADARGAPRPFGDGCDAGPLEFTTCLEEIVDGENSFVGRNSSDQIQGEFGENDKVLAQGGDDFISVYSNSDSVCAGSGDDEILPEDGSDAIDGDAGTDLVSYNNANAPLFVNLGAESATEPSGTDALFSIEDLQGTEGDDEIIGSGKDNLLIGGGGEDSIEGAGGEDTINAKDGEADEVIDCGPGDNAKEKAMIDEGLDPPPVSC